MSTHFAVPSNIRGTIAAASLKLEQRMVDRHLRHVAFRGTNAAASLKLATFLDGPHLRHDLPRHECTFVPRPH